MSDARRDCGIVFEVANNLGGRLISFRSALTILDKSGAEVKQGGIMDYDIDLFSFDAANLQTGQKRTATVDVEMSCADIASVQITEVDDKYCNYVGRQEGEVCKELIELENNVAGVSFEM